MTSKQRSRSFILVPIDFSYTTSYSSNSNFCCRTHRLATIHNVTDGQTDRRQTEHCSISATGRLKTKNETRTVFRFYPRDAMLARVLAIATCLSVSPSVTRRYCVKTKKASGMISSPSDSPKTLLFWRQISSPNSKGFPPNGGLKQG